MTAPLLPAEAALLVEPKASSASKFLQAALLTLLGRGHVVIEEEGRLLKRRYLRLQPGDGQDLPRHLATIKNSLAVNAIGGRLKASGVARSLQKSFGSDFRKYVHDVLAPPLISSGLLRREERRFLGIIPYTHYARTLSGEAAASPLVRMLEEAGGLRRLIRSDPDRAIRIAQMAGVLLVMSPGAKAQIPKLKALMLDRGGDSGGSHYADGGNGGSDLQVGFEVGDWSVFTDATGMLDGICSVGDFTGGDGGDGGGDGGGGGD